MNRIEQATRNAEKPYGPGQLTPKEVFLDVHLARRLYEMASEGLTRQWQTRPTDAAR